MNPICRNEFDKAKDLIRLRKESMGNYVKPKVQNLDSGILLQFFENWEDVSEEFNGKDIPFKKRIVRGDKALKQSRALFFGSCLLIVIGL